MFYILGKRGVLLGERELWGASIIVVWQHRILIDQLTIRCTIYPFSAYDLKLHLLNKVKKVLLLVIGIA